MFAPQKGADMATVAVPRR
ncbi:hypothetical protein [Mycobacterium tuberculosis]|nr:hypothetical protein [Mycobacterium tuberculosis]